MRSSKATPTTVAYRALVCISFPSDPKVRAAILAGKPRPADCGARRALVVLAQKKREARR